MPNDTILKAAVDTQIAVSGWRDTVVRRMTDPSRSKGQTAFEYLGIILVVVAIIGGIAASGIGGDIKKKISEQVDKVKAG
ncbi:hypothetical protein P8A22_13910 [Streptomyces laculatispora]|uniref:Integral membrane protein n=1 Tax=Streptomyces laculatispora TaxID=887464 RepID=A0ABY9I2D0_9ACTN|nr:MULTISPECIES: hypothetical protein [Streptomyces]MBO0918326.1 hypothetical protein [Streptomyces laculatispora]ROQ82425.1 hypothetical protein EDD95_2039 [Streptomyces sp. CEV 2-1]WLQ40986.1 hypothetical protein P8A22_13910 [Streptomyces laculatispora]